MSTEPAAERLERFLESMADSQMVDSDHTIRVQQLDQEDYHWVDVRDMTRAVLGRPTGEDGDGDGDGFSVTEAAEDWDEQGVEILMDALLLYADAPPAWVPEGQREARRQLAARMAREVREELVRG